jgi:Fe-S-cluster-containing hydrogenase component 2
MVLYGVRQAVTACRLEQVMKKVYVGEEVCMGCGLCPGQETPVCVVNCPNEALALSSNRDFGGKVR